MIKDAQLWLFRHGQAADKSPTNTFEEDYVRPLTEKGVKQSLRAGQLLKAIAPKMDGIYCSPRIRTVQSAVLIASQLKGTPKAHRDKHLLEMSHQDAEQLIQDHGAVTIVGHGPEIDDLIKHMTGRDVHTYRGTLAGIHIKDGQPELTKLLSAKDIAGLV